MNGLNEFGFGFRPDIEDMGLLSLGDMGKNYLKNVFESASGAKQLAQEYIIDPIVANVPEIIEETQKSVKAVRESETLATLSGEIKEAGGKILKSLPALPVLALSQEGGTDVPVIQPTEVTKIVEQAVKDPDMKNVLVQALIATNDVGELQAEEILKEVLNSEQLNDLFTQIYRERILGSAGEIDHPENDYDMKSKEHEDEPDDLMDGDCMDWVPII